MLIYLAGPLFSQAERAYNARLTAAIEALGYEVFLPQRDGVEKDREPYASMSQEDRRRAIFFLDRDKILVCDIFLFVLDGRVPDEGACVELGIAYCDMRLRRPDRHILGLQTDMRAAFPDAKLNPMIAVPLGFVAETEEALLQKLGDIAAQRFALQAASSLQCLRHGSRSGTSQQDDLPRVTACARAIRALVRRGRVGTDRGATGRIGAAAISLEAPASGRPGSYESGGG